MSSYRVPFVNAPEAYRRIQGEVDAAIYGCLSAGDLVLRQQLRDFEADFARFVGSKYCVGVNSGYHALHFSLIAAGIGPGDEVVTVAHTFVATVSAIVHAGATPVLIEVGKDYNMATDRLEAAVTKRTRAIIPVHLNGRVTHMGAVMDVATRHSLVVIEDAAQAIGAKFGGRGAGSIGTTGCFSFYPFKVLGGYGDGGAVTTNDQEIARKVALLRFNGEDRETGEYHCHGYTALLDNVQAAALRVKLRHLPGWLEHRRAMAERYRNGLEGVGDLQLPHFAGREHHDIFQNYVIRTKRRDALRVHLKERGVETLVHWPKPMWKHTGLALGEQNLPETEAICCEVISLPMSAELTAEQVDVTVDVVREFFR